HFSTMNSSRGAQPWRGAAGGAELTVALPSVLAGLCLAGLAGNLLLVAALVSELRRGPGPPPPASALLLNLGSADLLLALACLPARIAAYARRSWPFGGVLCRASDWLLHGCLVAKSLSWAAVGQARHRHHHLPAPPSKGPPPGWSRAHLAGVLASVWAAALLLPLPVLLFSRLEAPPPGQQLLACVFRPPAYAANFMDVFSKVYPLAAYLAPSAFTWACYARARRLQKERSRSRLAKPGGRRSQKATRVLFGLSLLFQALWLPGWVAWLWERHAPPGGSPPPALAYLAEVLVFLDASLRPGVLLATSEELRRGLRGLWVGLDCGRRGKGGAGGAGPGETPQPLRDLKPGDAPAPEKVLPDVEHFWKDRRNTAAGEESDPVPWEHQCDP
ncbi:UNVERIFIED_CONTAM: hypothetical protein K2H54_006228, partial [Gekko kuhli]